MAKWSLMKYYGKKLKNSKGESLCYGRGDALAARKAEEDAKAARGTRASRKRARNERVQEPALGRRA